MRKIRLKRLWEVVKLVTTKNLWLKILSFLLAVGIYVALYDNTIKKQDDETSGEFKTNFHLIPQKHQTAQPENKSDAKARANIKAQQEENIRRTKDADLNKKSEKTKTSDERRK